jgi:hypothetical protein
MKKCTFDIAIFEKIVPDRDEEIAFFREQLKKA